MQPFSYYTISPEAPWYFHPPIKASGAKGAKKGERPYASLIEKASYYRKGVSALLIR